MPDNSPLINQEALNAVIPVTGQPSGNLIPVTGQLSATDQASGGAAALSFQDYLNQLSKNQPQPSDQSQTKAATAASNFDSKTQGSLDSLQPDFADKAKLWIQGMRDAGYNPVLHFGYRSPQLQQELYQKYLAGGNKAVAPPMSYHTYGRAFDWVNQGSNGELEWNNDKAYEVGQSLASKYGLTGIRGDNDHIQDAQYKSWRDLPRTEYGNVRPRVAQAQTQDTTTPANPIPASVLSNVGVSGWQDLSKLLTK